MNKIKLAVLGLSYNHTNSGAYALVLSEEEGKRRIPIIIGAVEAQAIAIQLEGLTPPRPLTHDLFHSFAEAFQIQLEEVLVYKLKDGIFYSELLCNNGSHKIRIDSRTSDAVALALRFKVPIFTTSEIIENAGIILEDSVNEEDDSTPTESIVSTPESSDDLDELSVEELEDLLLDAITNEDYEQASKIRDIITNRKA